MKERKRPDEAPATYVVYKGETVLAVGTKEECAARCGVEIETIEWYSRPAAHRRHGLTGMVAYRYTEEELEQ